MKCPTSPTVVRDVDELVVLRHVLVVHVGLHGVGVGALRSAAVLVAGPLAGLLVVSAQRGGTAEGRHVHRQLHILPRLPLTPHRHQVARALVDEDVLVLQSRKKTKNRNEGTKKKEW